MLYDFSDAHGYPSALRHVRAQRCNVTIRDASDLARQKRRGHSGRIAPKQILEARPGVRIVPLCPRQRPGGVRPVVSSKLLMPSQEIPRSWP